ncbi:hypothetical protein JYU34_004350 [Plutella xylostella]|uniref:FLYWCH-type domain-containing protein n=1 Tax=Plutella xylostella TaxID=51655 RepID=A0ABQ7QXV9_PLUXY|nr:hypothetical protein JYU34_004350 [Plutella xylostella]
MGCWTCRETTTTSRRSTTAPGTDSLSGVLIPSRMGKHPVLLYNNYSYNFVNNKTEEKLWYCIKRGRLQCKAYVKTHKETPETPYEVNEVHNHQPARYHITKTGQYILI